LEFEPKVESIVHMLSQKIGLIFFLLNLDLRWKIKSHAVECSSNIKARLSPILHSAYTYWVCAEPRWTLLVLSFILFSGKGLVGTKV